MNMARATYLQMEISAFISVSGVFGHPPMNGPYNIRVKDWFRAQLFEALFFLGNVALVAYTTYLGFQIGE
jgi:hypothetical protein